MTLWYSLTVVPTRWFNLGAFAACALLLGYAYYAQFYLGLEPCPLCIFQRIALIALAAVFALAGAHDPGRAGARVYASLIAVVALLGAGIAGRHVWLQSLPPDQVPACGPDLEYMLDLLPITEVIRKVFTGSGECAEIDWTFLGLAMPGWVLLWFVVLGVLGTWRNLANGRWT